MKYICIISHRLIIPYLYYNCRVDFTSIKGIKSNKSQGLSVSPIESISKDR